MIGEISAAESNFNSRKRERIKNKAKGRGNNGSPREFTHQLAVPRWMDRKCVKMQAKEWDCPEDVAREYLLAEDAL